jgi:ATP synthase subunit 6
MVSFFIVKNMVVNSPLEQFEVLNFGYLFTNAQFFLISAILIISLLWYIYSIHALWIPGSKQSYKYIFELFYSELLILVFRNVGGKYGQVYFSWLIFTFFFVSSANLIGMIPFTFTITSHIIVTLAISFYLFVAINIQAITYKEVSFTGLFVPSGAPTTILPFLVIIEIISYIARVFSLAIRLFANMMAGHSLLKILIGFAFVIGFKLNSVIWPLYFLGLIPFFIVFLITFLEVAIALLQGYVFTVLMCLYIKDLHTSH